VALFGKLFNKRSFTCTGTANKHNNFFAHNILNYKAAKVTKDYKL